MPNEIRPQTGPQEQFLKCSADVAFYGGAAGGGKTYALLLNPLYHCDNPKFGAVTFRRTTKQVRSEGGLWDTAEQLYSSIGAKANGQDLSFKFKSGARHTFAHMEHEKNRLDWQGSQIPLIQFDELTHFTWPQFSYMLSRNRSVSGVPSRMRATLNPDPDHWARRFIDWWISEDGFAIPERSGVVRWFVLVNDDVIWSDDKDELAGRYPKSTPKSFTFIKSSLEDNQILMDADPGYLASLQAMPRVERARLLDGNWNIRPSAGMYFRRSDFDVVETAPHCVKWVRAWDQAGTKKTAKNPNPDWTAGAKMGRTPGGQYVVAHMERFQENPSAVDRRIKNTASSDGKETMIRLAQDPGQAGKSQARSQISMLSGYNVKAKPVTGDKETRAKPFSAQCEAGNVLVVRGSWNEGFFRELENFPEGENDDQVDAVSDAFDELVVTSEPRIRTL